MKMFKHVLFLVLLVFTGILIILPNLSADMAGNFYFLSLLAWPLFIVDIIIWFFVKKECIWQFFFMVVVLGCFTWVWNYIPFSWPSANEKLKQQFTLVSWNVDNMGVGYQNYTRMHQQSQQILAQRPDIICIQERPHTNVISWDSIQSCFPDYPYKIINSREDEVLNLAVISKYPLLNHQEYYYDNTYNKMMAIDVNVKGTIIRIFNVHLQTTGINGAGDTESKNHINKLKDNAKLRNHQAGDLHVLISSSRVPVIVCGDFNDTRSSYAYRTVSNGLIDCHKSAGKGWGGTYNKFRNLVKIDYILCTKDLGVNSYELKDTELSDHKMQKVKIELN
ncbi:MAG: endonuclease/exonuclease/phosphatase family protein [Phocaeicola sp.]